MQFSRIQGLHLSLKKVVIREYGYRYASLYFAVIIDKEENGFLALEVLHQYVEVLDRYFGSVCELDIIFNFHKAYQIIDEILIGGYVHESSKKQSLKYVAQQDTALEESKDDDSDKKA